MPSASFHRALKLLLFLLPTLLFAKGGGEQPLPPLETGNFSLPVSQEPGPLVSFGENIVDKGEVQLFVMSDGFFGKNTYSTDIIPGLLWGVTENLSFFFNVPVSPGNKSDHSKSSGLEDVFAQFEYLYYNKVGTASTDQATLVANISFPSGSSSKTPPTGFGSTIFFIGGTYNHTGINWFFFTSPGGVLTTSNHKTKFGNQFLYQCGLGRNFPSPAGWIFAWMVEFDGTYAWKNKIHGMKDPNSGGNIIYVTPSLWISSKRLILQFGAGYPVVQHLFGNQPRQFISFDFNLGITL